MKIRASYLTDEENGIELTEAEKSAIAKLMRLSFDWPQSLILFGGAGTSISVRKRADDGSYFAGQEVASVAIPSDGVSGHRRPHVLNGGEPGRYPYWLRAGRKDRI